MGFFGGSSVDLASPGPIGSTTPNTGKFTTLTLAPSANTTPFTASGYSLTGTNAQSLFDLSGTWNTSGTPTAIKLNVTDTASNASSLLMDLQVGGSSRFSIDKGGAIIVKASTGLSDRSITALGTTSGMSFDSSNGYVLTANQYSVRFNRGGDAGVTIRSDSAFGITSGNADGTIDTILRRDAADAFAQRRSTNAQTFRLYNTYTDASNYERGFFRWSSNVLEIGAEAAGTGTSRNISFIQSGSTRLTIGGTITANVSINCGQYIYGFFGLGGRSASADPTSSDLASGFFNVFKNTTSGTVKLWYNDGGTMKSVALA